MNQGRKLSAGIKCIMGILIVAAVVVLPLTPSVFAQTVSNEDSMEAEYNPAGFLIKTRLSLGVLNGESHEIVYFPPANWKVSELIWELDSVYMLGGGLSVRPLQWLGLNLDGWIAISEGDGDMDDYDWLVLGYNDWTHWSHHEKTDLTDGTMFDINAEFFVFQKKQFSLSFLAGYKRNNWKWESYGGRYVYSVNGFRDQVGVWPDNELVITYEQWFDVPYIGIGMVAQAGPIQFSGRIIGSNQVDAEDEDHHHLRNLVFTEDFEDGDFIGIQLGADYNITQNLSVGIAIDYQDFDEIKGATRVRDTTTGAVEYFGGDSAGIDNELMLFSIGGVYRF